MPFFNALEKPVWPPCLIVDDDNIIRETLRDLLADTHECHTADRAEQALAYLELETYDVVLTDIAMPGLTGHDILKQIQQEHPTTPVIVISGDSQDEAAKELLSMGAFAFIAKPFRLEDVESTVVRAYRSSQELKQSRVSDQVVDSRGGPPWPPLFSFGQMQIVFVSSTRWPRRATATKQRAQLRPSTAAESCARAFRSSNPTPNRPASACECREFLRR